jgi:hypothetical protein
VPALSLLPKAKFQSELMNPTRGNKYSFAWFLIRFEDGVKDQSPLERKEQAFFGRKL